MIRSLSCIVNEGRSATPYHHGNLRPSLIDAALLILERDGLAALTLRGVAREANVSHSAPKNHFENLQGLLSELAAEGFRRLRQRMDSEARDCPSSEQRLAALGREYVRFAIEQPALFSVMFRGERHDMSRPSLRQAAGELIDMLAAASNPDGSADTVLAADQATSVILAWSQVHGLASLLIDGKLEGLARRLPAEITLDVLIERILR